MLCFCTLALVVFLWLLQRASRLTRVRKQRPFSTLMSKEVLCIPCTFIFAYLSLNVSVPLNDSWPILYLLHSSRCFLKLCNISSANLRLRWLSGFHSLPRPLAFSLSVLWLHLHFLGVQFPLSGPVSEVHSPALNLPWHVGRLAAWLSRNHHFWITVTTFSLWASRGLSFCPFLFHSGF